VNVGAVLILVVAALAVFVIAAITIGREAHRLDAVAPRATYVLDDAVDYVADHLDDSSQARLTLDEVRLLLVWHMAYLRDKGLQPPVAVDHRQDIVDPVVVDETNVAGLLMGKADEAGMDVEDEDVVRVVDGHLAYLDTIGAVGPQADEGSI
jgi:hypothetical protein